MLVFFFVDLQVKSNQIKSKNGFNALDVSVNWR